MRFSIDQAIMEKALNYMASKPFNEVAQIGSISGRDGATSAAASSHACDNYNNTYKYFRITPTNWSRKGLGTDQYCAIGELYIYGDTAQ